MAMGTVEEEFPVAASEEDIKEAFDQCREETGSNSIQDLSHCASSKLKLSERPEQKYTKEDIEEAFIICEKSVANLGPLNGANLQSNPIFIIQYESQKCPPLNIHISFPQLITV